MDQHKSVDSDFSLGRSSLSGRSSQESSARRFNRSGDPKDFYDEDKEDHDFDFENENDNDNRNGDENEEMGMKTYNDEMKGSVKGNGKKSQNNNNKNNNDEGVDNDDEDEEGAEYSSDDFDHSFDVKDPNNSPTNAKTIKNENVNNDKMTLKSEVKDLEVKDEKEMEKDRDRDKKVEKLSDEEIDRRRSIEIIKERWLNPMNVPAPVPFVPFETVQILDPVPLVLESSAQVLIPESTLIVENDTGVEEGVVKGEGEGKEVREGEGEGVGDLNVNDKRKSLSPSVADLKNQDDRDDNENKRGQYNEDDGVDARSQEEESDNDRNTNEENNDEDDDEYNKYDDGEDSNQQDNTERRNDDPDESNTSMMSRYDHRDDDNVLGTGTFHTSSRYECPESTSQSQSQSQSQSYSHSQNKSMESASVCSQSNDGLIGMRLLTTIGSSSMVTSVPTPFSITTTLPQFIDQRACRSPTISSSSFTDIDRPLDRQGYEALNNMGTRFGVADGDLRDLSTRHLAQDSTDDLAGLLNRRSVTFQSDQVINQDHQTGSSGDMKGSSWVNSDPANAPWRGLQIGITDDKKNQYERIGSSNIININRTNEYEINHLADNIGKSASPPPSPSSNLDQHQFSHINPKSINMFQSHVSSLHPVCAPPTDATQASSTSNNRHTSRSNSPMRRSIESHLISSNDRAKTPSPFRPLQNPPVGPVSWPHELPMSAPSPNELYAQLAMISSAADRRAADLVSVKAKISNQGSKVKVKAKNSTPRVSTPANDPALNRLEQGTARLTRQFQSLQMEISNMSLKNTKGQSKDRSPNITHTRSNSTSRPDRQSLIPFRSGSSISRDNNYNVSSSKSLYDTSGLSRSSLKDELSVKKSRDICRTQNSSSAGRREDRRNSRTAERYGGQCGV